MSCFSGPRTIRCALHILIGSAGSDEQVLVDILAQLRFVGYAPFLCRNELWWPVCSSCGTNE